MDGEQQRTNVLGGLTGHVAIAGAPATANTEGLPSRHEAIPAKFTPGPWTIEDGIEDELIVVESGKPAYGGSDIALVDTSGDNIDPREAKANAHLIAAAPELYAALVDVKRWCLGSPMTLGEVMKYVNDAITKVEGREA